MNLVWLVEAAAAAVWLVDTTAAPTGELLLPVMQFDLSMEEVAASKSIVPMIELVLVEEAVGKLLGPILPLDVVACKLLSPMVEENLVDAYAAVELTPMLEELEEAVAGESLVPMVKLISSVVEEVAAEMGELTLLTVELVLTLCKETAAGEL